MNQPSAFAQQFTGKERDAESGLGLLGARYMGSSLGRFTSPDPLLNSGQPWEPQSWNRYSYALGNPLRYIDPTGLYVWDASLGGSDSDEDLRNKRKLAKQNKDKTEAKRLGSVLGTRKNVRRELGRLGSSNTPTLTAAASAIGAEGVDRSSPPCGRRRRHACRRSTRARRSSPGTYGPWNEIWR